MSVMKKGPADKAVICASFVGFKRIYGANAADVEVAWRGSYDYAPPLRSRILDRSPFIVDCRGTIKDTAEGRVVVDISVDPGQLDGIEAALKQWAADFDKRNAVSVSNSTPGYFTPEPVDKWLMESMGLIAFDPQPAETRYECGVCHRKVVCESLPSGWTMHGATSWSGNFVVTTQRCGGCS